MKKIWALVVGISCVANPAYAGRVVLTSGDVANLLSTQKLSGGDKHQMTAMVARGPGQQVDLSDPSTRQQIAERLLGHGFDLWSNKPTQNRCVDYPTAYAVFTSAVPGVPSKYNWSNLAAVSNLSEHVSNSSLGGSASATYGAFSLGIGAAAASSNKFSSYSSYIDVDKGLVGDVAELSQPPQSHVSILPSQLAKTAIKSSPAIFAQRCGQAYVSRVMFGQHLAGTLDYTTTMNQSSSSNSVAVSAAVSGILGGSFSSADSYSKLNEEATLAYRITGGPAQDNDPSKWLDGIRSYGADGNFNGANTEIVIDTTSYGELPDPLFADFVTADTAAQGTITTLRASYTDSIQLLSDLLFARSNPAHFTGITPDQLKTEIKTVSQYLDDVGKVYLTCRTAVDKTSVKACTDSAQALKAPDYMARPTLS